MKRISYLLLLLFILCSNGLFAQEGETLSEFCQGFSYQAIETGLNDLQKKSTAKVKYKWQTKLQRELINDFFEQIIELNKEVQDPENSSIYTVYTHKIKLIKKKEGEVTYYKVIELKNVKSKGEWGPTEIVLKEDSNKTFQQLKTDFKNAYFQPLNFDELFATDIVYGDYCGYAGMEPEFRVKMNQLVESKDTATLIAWLQSATIEVQLYAIDGILSLKQSGVEFDKTVLDLIELIGRKEGTAYTCSGCIHWKESIHQTIEKIKKVYTKD